VIRSFSISEQYQSLIDDLAICGFRETSVPPTLFLCPYDWRKDNALAASLLANTIDSAVQLHGAGTEISIIAHSMGGLVARYYLESGTYDARPGFKAVRRLITLGTPHRGAPLALSAAVGLQGRLFLDEQQIQRLVSDPRYPSLYQLLPPSGEPFAWNEESSAAFATLDIYEKKTAAALGLVPANLEAAQGFHAKLDLGRRPSNDGQPVRYFFFAGTRQKTAASIGLLDKQTNPLKYRVRSLVLEDAGDETVPLWSGMITGVQGQPVGGSHATIYRNDELRRTLAILLGAPGVLAAVPERVEVALRERVVKPTDVVHVALTFASGVDKLDGTLSVQRALISDNQPLYFAQPTSLHPISYAGLNAEKLTVMFSAPGSAGVYRIAYFPKDYREPAGSDELFVQGVA
jgi:phospholipase A1